MYNLKSSVERFIWRLRKENGKHVHFYPNEKDVSAFNVILSWINRQKEGTVNNNQLFAKLYIYFLTQSIRYYETDVLDNIPQKELSRVLDTPLANFYKAFEVDLHSAQISKIVQRAKKEDGKFFDINELQAHYSSEFITAHLNHMISEALNRFS